MSKDSFDILHEVYIYKHKVVFIETPEWRLKDKLTRNTKFEVNQDEIFVHFGPKIAKIEYFRDFYFSQSVFKSHTW